MARGKVTYEWAIEESDAHGDIFSVDHCQFYADALELKALLQGMAGRSASVDIALLRHEGNEVDGETRRHYAYVRDGKLETVFSSFHGAGPNEDQPANDGPDVPQRFLKEVEAATPAGQSS